MFLRGLVRLGIFSTISMRETGCSWQIVHQFEIGDNFCDFLLLSGTAFFFFEKGSTLI